MRDHLTIADVIATHADQIERYGGAFGLAIAATYTFLAINGVDLKASADKTYAFIAELYHTNAFRFDALVKWLRANT